MKHKLRLTVEFEYETQPGAVDWEFYFEEHVCTSDLVERLSGERCMCYKSKVEYLGPADANS
jgi:hypothetical protein